MDQNGDIGTAARMVAAGLLSAIVTAGLVIAIGQALIQKAAPDAPAPASDAMLIRTTG